ncbi:MAG TPA: MFS transporter [Acetobacteraceae bacterium]|jgi:MFS family permease
MPSRRSAGYEFTIMVLLVLFWGCIGLNRAGIGFIFPIIVPLFHMQLWQAGLLISGTSITWAFSSWIGGWLSDNRGRRAILLPAVAFTALATAAMGATWNFLSMFVVRDLLGLGDGIGWSVGQATISEEAAPQRRGFNQALYNAGYSFFGVGLGALIVTTLATSLGWRWVFPIIGIATAVVFVALFALMREPASHATRRKVAWREAAGLLGNRSVLLITLTGCATLAWLQLSIGYNVLFLTRVRHFSLIEAGTVVSAWGLIGTAGQVLLPLASDFLGRRPVIILSALLCAATLGIYIVGDFDINGMRILAGTSGFFGFGLGPIVIATCVSELVPVEMRGAALGMTNFFAVVVGTAVMPVVGGIVADHFGLPAALWLAVGAQILMAALVIGIVETAPRVVRRRALSAAAE